MHDAQRKSLRTYVARIYVVLLFASFNHMLDMCPSLCVSEAEVYIESWFVLLCVCTTFVV